MLSIFPELLVYTLAAPFILRLAAGSLFLVWAARVFGSEKHMFYAQLAEWNVPKREALVALSFFEVIVGGLLVVGLYTQAAAIAGAILAGMYALLSRREPFGFASMLAYTLVALICLSLTLTGPGFFAFDLPL